MCLILTLCKIVLSWAEMVHSPLIKSALSFAWMINKMRKFSVLLWKLYSFVFLHSFLFLTLSSNQIPKVIFVPLGSPKNYNLWLNQVNFLLSQNSKTKQQQKCNKKNQLLLLFMKHGIFMAKIAQGNGEINFNKLDFMGIKDLWINEKLWDVIWIKGDIPIDFNGCWTGSLINKLPYYEVTLRKQHLLEKVTRHRIKEVIWHTEEYSI